MLDSFLEYDADHQIDADQPRPVVFKCLNAHAIRRHDVEAVRPAAARQRLCVVCGIEVRGQAKTCSPEHRRFLERKRYEADLIYRKTPAGRAGSPFRFRMELEPWYRGAVTAFKPAIPPSPIRELPEDWWRGYQRAYGIESHLSDAVQRG